MKTIKMSRSTHGVIDYLSVVFMLIAPWAFGFTAVGAATACFITAAVAVLGMSLFTNYELGIKKNLPMSFHLDMDMVLGLCLAISPWLFDFSNEVLWPHVFMGCFAIIAGLITDRNSQLTSLNATKDN